ncbi:hypothetical protein [Chitinophaga sp. HK235]|nr:hypothetical protein [Chitinophaga sp. HK235]
MTSTAGTKRKISKNAFTINPERLALQQIIDGRSESQRILYLGGNNP